MKYCYKCGTKLTDEMIFCHNCGEKVIIPNSVSIHEQPSFRNVSNTDNVSQRPKPKKRIAMGVVGMVLGYIALFFSTVLTLMSIRALDVGVTLVYQVLFWMCFIPSSIMTILNTIFSFVSRYQSDFKNQVTTRGIMCSIINLGMLLFSLLVYLFVE